MALTLYAHPFSSYCWKVLIALYENATPFQLRLVADAAGWAELEALWPMKKFPVLKDGDRVVAESSVIIEYLCRHHPGPVMLLPPDPDAALDVRFIDRFLDQYVMTPMVRIVGDRLRASDAQDAHTVAESRQTLDRAYAWLDARLAGDGTLCGVGFSLADCSAAPALFYADWVQPVDARFALLRAYRRRILAHPSVARVVEEARPYRSFFPGGAPERD